MLRLVMALVVLRLQGSVLAVSEDTLVLGSISKCCMLFIEKC
jgi:hypothetical protein